MNLFDLIDKLKQDYGIGNSTILRDDYAELLDNEEEKNIFILLKNILSMEIYVENNDLKVYPMFRFADGTKSFDLEDLTEEKLKMLETIDLTRLPESMQAKLKLLLWIKSKNVDGARYAAKYYYNQFKIAIDPENWVRCCDYLEKAIVLYSKLGDKDAKKSCLQYVYDKVIELNGKDELFLSIKFIEILLNQKFDCDYSVFLPILDNLIQEKKEVRTKAAYTLKAKLFLQLKDKENSEKTYIEYAAHLEKIADVDEDEYTMLHDMQRIHFYKEAIQVYRNHGKPDEAKRLMAKLSEVEKKSVDNMTHFRYKLDLSDLKKQSEIMFKDLDIKESIVQLSRYITFRSIDEIKADVIQKYRSGSIEMMFTKIRLDNRGRTIAKLKPLNVDDLENEELIWHYMFYEEHKREEYEGSTFFKAPLLVLCEMQFEINDLMFMFENNPTIPDNRKQIIAEGIYYALKGNIYVAIHILAPQMENVFRCIAEACGDVITSLNDGQNGAEDYVLLSSIFDLPELNECYDENILFTFRGLLNEKLGSNFRNLVAHGLLEEKYANSGCGIFFVCAVLKFIVMTSPKCLDILLNSKKLYENEKEAEKVEIDIEKIVSRV